MLFRSALLLLLSLLLLFVLFIQCESLNSISSTHSKGKYPFLSDDEASQWLSTRNLPRRWHHQHHHQSSNEIDQTLKQLQTLNDNGVRQFDSQTFEGVSMEVIFEMVYKQQNNPNAG